MDAAKLVAAQLIGEVFDGAAQGVGVAGFGVEGELVVEAFCVEDVVQAQAHALAAVAEGEGAALAGEAFFQRLHGVGERAFLHWLAQKPHGIALEAVEHVLIVAGDKDNEHAVVDGIDGVGGVEAVESIHFHIEKEGVVTHASLFIGSEKGFAAVVKVHIVVASLQKGFDGLNVDGFVVANGTAHGSFLLWPTVGRPVFL